MSRNQSGIRVGIVSITDITNCLTLAVYVIEHMDKILLIITVITITLGHIWSYIVQSSLDRIVYVRDRSDVPAMLCKMSQRQINNASALFVGQVIHSTISGLTNRGNDLLTGERFDRTIFLLDIQHRHPSYLTSSRRISK